MLSNCKNHNHQLKGELARCKKKLKDAMSMLMKLQKDADDERKAKDSLIIINPKDYQNPENSASSGNSEVEILKAKLNEMSKASPSGGKTPEEYQRRIRQLEELVDQLKKDLAACKQEEEVYY